ncbi:GlxA family transcriptional regulator [Agrobacterium vitis]|nr:GlxA family transcriptional regulator [Agrobacterium vitis]
MSNITQVRSPRSENDIAFYLMEGFSMHGFSSALSALHLVNEMSDEERYSWRIVSLDGGDVTSDCGIRVASDLPLKDEKRYTASKDRPSLVVVCGGTPIAAGTTSLNTWLRECVKNRMLVAALASGVFVPASAGLFKDRRWAVHWEQYPAFAERFPDLKTTQSLYEIDGDLLTCAGGAAAFDMFLKIAEWNHSPSCLKKVCDKAMVDRRRDPGLRQRIPLQAEFGVLPEAVITAVEQMEANVVDPLCLDQIADKAGISRRQLERLFRKGLGRAPSRYYAELRLERAALLLTRSEMSVTDVAIACGFVSSSHFTKLFRANYGIAPQKMRTAAMSAAKQAKPTR